MVLGGVRLLLSRIPLSRCHKRCSLDRNRMQMTRFSFYDHDATQSEWAHRLCLSGVHYCEDHTVTQLSRTRFLRVVVTKFSQLHWRTQTLKWGGGGKGRFLSLALPAFFPAAIFFLTQNIEEGEGGGPGPSPRSAAEFSKHRGKRRFAANDTLSC